MFEPKQNCDARCGHENGGDAKSHDNTLLESWASADFHGWRAFDDEHGIPLAMRAGNRLSGAFRREFDMAAAMLADAFGITHASSKAENGRRNKAFCGLLGSMEANRSVIEIFQVSEAHGNLLFRNGGFVFDEIPLDLDFARFIEDCPEVEFAFAERGVV